MTFPPLHRLWLAAALFSAGCGRAAATPEISTTAMVAAPATAANFETEIAAFEAADRAHPPAPGGILFLGSSSIRMWSGLQQDFPGVSVLNRGFGGSTFADVLYFTPRIVLPARPRLIVLYVGDNDLSAGRTADQVATDYATFVAFVRRALPETRIAFVSIKPSPSRWALADAMRRANELIAGQIARGRTDSYVDVFTPMLGHDGRPVPSLFLADSLHMTRAGYAIWRAQLAPLVR
ncbi:MAG: SGNH/GDSL hydrolase family protein [bacterium]